MIKTNVEEPRKRVLWVIELYEGVHPVALCNVVARNGSCQNPCNGKAYCPFVLAKPAIKTNMEQYKGTTFSVEHDLFYVEKNNS
jgi:hypothetical protein